MAIAVQFRNRTLWQWSHHDRIALLGSNFRVNHKPKPFPLYVGVRQILNYGRGYTDLFESRPTFIAVSNVEEKVSLKGVWHHEFRGLTFIGSLSYGYQHMKQSLYKDVSILSEHGFYVLRSMTKGSIQLRLLHATQGKFIVLRAGGVC